MAYIGHDHPRLGTQTGQGIGARKWHSGCRFREPPCPPLAAAASRAPKFNTCVPLMVLRQRRRHAGVDRL